MPTTDGYGQKVPYPVMSDAPNIELAFQGAVNALTKQTVLRFANANERSATLMGAFAAVPGMLSYLIAEDRWDQFDGDGVWRPLTREHGSPSRSHRVTPHSAAARIPHCERVR
ncbi:hypothetical protein SMICM304S_02375 [Streptomyces microflavus]